MSKKIKHSLKIIFIIVLFVFTTKQADFITQMKQMKNTNYKQIFHKPVNVSIGQKLTLVLPSFDSTFSQQSFQVLKINDAQYKKEVQVSLNQNVQNMPSQDKQTVQTGQKLSLRNLPMKCEYIPPKGQVLKVLSSLNYDSGINYNFQNKHYVHVSSKQLLYVLNGKSMLLSAYYYNDKSIIMVSSFQLPIDKNVQQNTDGYQAYQSVSMALNSIQTELYVFSSLGIWQIQTKTILTNIKFLTTISGFSSVDSNGLDKILHASSKLFFAMKKMGKVYLIPQSFSQNKTFKQIKTFNGSKIFPQDIYLESTILYVLDIYNGIYIYRILGNGQIEELDFILLQNNGGNFQFHVLQKNIFVNFNDNDGSKIVQIHYDINQKQAHLVRYYKNDDFISFMNTFSVLTSDTGFTLSSFDFQKYREPQEQIIDLKNVENSFQNLLFLISNFQEIQIYPYNIDPRTIQSVYNGVKIALPQVKFLYHVIQDKFIVITQKDIKYCRLTIRKPQVSCKIGSKFNQESSVNIQNLKILIHSNISSCQRRNHLLKPKQSYNQNCLLTTQYLVHFNDPQHSSLQKILIQGVVLLVVVCFIAGLICLIKWRNQKMLVLGRLKQQIIKFRNRHKKLQPFTEQKIEKKQIQLQVPKDIEYIPNQDDN